MSFAHAENRKDRGNGKVRNGINWGEKENIYRPFQCQPWRPRLLGKEKKEIQSSRDVADLRKKKKK